MFLSKCKFAGLALLALVMVVSGAGLLASRNPGATLQASAPPSARPAAGKETSPDKPDEKTAKADKPPEKAENPVKLDQSKPAPKILVTSAEVRKALMSLVQYPGLDDPKANLVDDIDRLARVHRLTFDVNERTFKADQLADVLKIEIANPNAIPPMSAPLAKVLNKILSRVPAPSGATFLLRKGGIIEITTEAAVRRELGLPPATPDAKGQIVERLPPLVWEAFNEAPLRGP